MELADSFRQESEERTRLVRKICCQSTLELNSDRIPHFKLRAEQLGFSPRQVVIVLLNVNDEHGGPLAEQLMPGEDWKRFRDRGQVPFARGLAIRSGIESVLRLFDDEAAAKLHAMKGLSIVVVAHGVAEVFAA